MEHTTEDVALDPEVQRRLDDEAVREAQRRLLSARREKVLSKTGPLPLADVTTSAVDAIEKARLAFAAMSPEELARRDARRVATARRAEHQRLVTACNLRGVPTEASVWDVVMRDEVPLTEALKQVLLGLRWRAKHGTPGGKRPGYVLVLAGTNGCGKTTAAAWVVARYPGTAMFLPAGTLGEFPDTAWGEYVAMREKWRTTGLLVLDDVGSERGERAKRFVAERVGPLLYDRYNAGLPTIVTTNRPSEQFCATYLVAEDPVLGERGEVIQKGNERLASRLDSGQLARGAPYWSQLLNAADYRSAEGSKRLSGIRTVRGSIVESWAVSGDAPRPP